MKESAPTGFVDHFVFSKKSPFMQRIGDLVRTGHLSYVQGQISVEKAGFLARKFADRYAILRTKLQASRARQSGSSTTRLLFLRQDGRDELHWVLLHVQGTESDSHEKWRDAIVDRITLTGYELVRLTKPEEPKPVWTWRYTRKRHDELRQEFIACIRQRRDRDLERLIMTTWRTPGFHGAREQVKKLKELICAEWKRNRGNEKLPEIPDRIGYVRRLPDVGLKLSTLRRNMLAEGIGRSIALPNDRPVPEGRFWWPNYETRVEDVSVSIVSLLEEIVARRMRESPAEQSSGAIPEQWVASFLVWPHPRFKLSRSIDMVAHPLGLAEVLSTLAELPAACFQ